MGECVCVSLLEQGCGGNVRLYRGLLRPTKKKIASWHRAVGAMSDSIGAFSDSIVVAQRENGAKSALGALAAAANSRADTRPDRLRCMSCV